VDWRRGALNVGNCELMSSWRCLCEGVVGLSDIMLAERYVVAIGEPEIWSRGEYIKLENQSQGLGLDLAKWKNRR
jgi:hypothetical protein